MKKVSIIMGMYNEEVSWIEESINSLLKQTYRNIEIIIILDNPQNLMLKNFVEQIDDQRIKFYLNKKNLGLIDTLNKAISLSTGDYIARMDADDVSDIHRIKKQVEFLEKNKEIDMIGTKIEFIDEQGNIIRQEGYRPMEVEVIKKHLKYFNAFAHPTLMFRKETLIDLNGYRNILYAEDYDLVLRYISSGKKIMNIDYIGLKYRVRKNGISISKENKQLMISEYLRKAYAKKDYNIDFEELEKYCKDVSILQEFTSYSEKKSNLSSKKNIINIKNYICVILFKKNIRQMFFEKKIYSLKRRLIKKSEGS